MTKFYCKILLLCAFLMGSAYSGSCQANEIKIRFIGNCGLHLTNGTSDFYVDFPYKSGAYNYMEYSPSEIEDIKPNAIFIFTHRHADHYSKKVLKKLKGKKFDPWNISELEKLKESIPDFTIQAFKTSHKFFGIPFKHCSYVITWHGKKIYFSGDTGDLEAVSKLKDIDWAFMNPWLFMNAQNENVRIDTKKYGIYHLYPDQKLPEQVPDKILFLKNQGEVITIPY
jgi:hypothetical protein